MKHQLKLGRYKASVYSNRQTAEKFAKRCNKNGAGTAIARKHGVYIVAVGKVRKSFKHGKSR